MARHSIKISYAVIAVLLSVLTAHAIQVTILGGTLNGEIGTANEDTGSQTILAQFWYFNTWQPSTSGNVRYIRAYMREDDVSTSTVCLSLWSDSSGNPGSALGYCSIQWDSGTPAWRHCDMGSSIALSAGVDYWLGIAETEGVAFFYFSTDGTPDHVDRDSIGVGASCPDANLTIDGTFGTAPIAIHANNVDQAAP